MIVALGTGGMSSDETDTEASELNQIKACRIRRPYWRAPAVGPFLHTIDSVSTHIKIHVIKPGGQRRERWPSTTISHRAGIVQGLPKNCYHPDILNQGEGVFDAIRPQGEVDLTHANEIME